MNVNIAISSGRMIVCWAIQKADIAGILDRRSRVDRAMELPTRRFPRADVAI